MRSIALLLIALISITCQPPPRTTANPAVVTPADSDFEATEVLEPREEEPSPSLSRCDPREPKKPSPEGFLLPLPVPGFRDSLISFPIPPARLSNEPLVVAAHGAGDNAESQCLVWREILGPCGVILCLAGTAIGPGDRNGFFFRDHHALEAELVAAMRALENEFGAEIALENALYVAYSQGATMGALMLPRHAKRFPRLILIEGGDAAFSAKSAREYLEGGGMRILFVCGTGTCAKNARRTVTEFERLGLTGRLLWVPEGGHAYWGVIADRVAQIWPWVVEGLPGWHEEAPEQVASDSNERPQPRER